MGIDVVAPAREMPWREAALLCGLLTVIHGRDYLQAEESTDRKTQLIVSASLGLGVAACLFPGLLSLCMVANILNSLPGCCALICAITGLTIPVANGWALFRLMVSWGVVTAAAEFMVLPNASGSSTLKRICWVGGHVALIPSISAPGVDLSEAYKATGFVLSLFLGSAMPLAVAMASRRLATVEGNRRGECEPRALQAEQRAAESKGRILALQSELEVTRMKLHEVQSTCNRALVQLVAAEKTQRQLRDLVTSLVPTSRWPPILHTLLDGSEDDSSEDDDEDDAVLSQGEDTSQHGVTERAGAEQHACRELL